MATEFLSNWPGNLEEGQGRAEAVPCGRVQRVPGDSLGPLDAMVVAVLGVVEDLRVELVPRGHLPEVVEAKVLIVGDDLVADLHLTNEPEALAGPRGPAGLFGFWFSFREVAEEILLGRCLRELRGLPVTDGDDALGEELIGVLPSACPDHPHG